MINFTAMQTIVRVVSPVSNAPAPPADACSGVGMLRAFTAGSGCLTDVTVSALESIPTTRAIETNGTTAIV
jgi:hypothetical protein